MAFRAFEEIKAWQSGQDLAVRIYRLFQDSQDWGFRDQICRAAVSVSNNIAEGFERNGAAEFKRFLMIAKGSCAEVRSMAYLAQRLDKISETEKDELVQLCNKISGMIYRLVQSIKTE